MCLFVEVKDHMGHLRIAKEPIRCYKIVKSVNGKYMTPFQDTKIPKMTMKGISRLTAEGDDMETIAQQTSEGKICATSGVIHTMSNMNEAVDFITYIRDRCWGLQLDGMYEIWECVIPKGVKYMEGKDGNCYDCLGSKSIKFIKRICV